VINKQQSVTRAHLGRKLVLHAGHGLSHQVEGGGFAPIQAAGISQPQVCKHAVITPGMRRYENLASQPCCYPPPTHLCTSATGAATQTHYSHWLYKMAPPALQPQPLQLPNVTHSQTLHIPKHHNPQRYGPPALRHPSTTALLHYNTQQHSLPKTMLIALDV
jgi:hypothetical protein